LQKKEQYRTTRGASGESMAFRSNGPTMLALPAFRGATRRIILTALSVYLATLFVSLFLPRLAALVNSLMLHPDQAIGRYVWQIVTYPFISLTLFGALFSMLSLWFFGSALEDERGPLWMTEYFFVSTIGGGALACVLSRTLLANTAGLSPAERTFGLWPAVLALVLAFARFHPEQEITFNFIFRVKAKFLAAIYLLIYLALSLSSHQQFDALTALCAALCGFVYLTLAPRRGLRYAASEKWYSLRNAWYRRKRQQAARKFEVYMSKQGKTTSVAEEKRDPADRKWMN